MPDGKVDEVTFMLEPAAFYKDYIQDKKPVVFREAVQDVPAMTSWQKDEYLKKK